MLVQSKLRPAREILRASRPKSNTVIVSPSFTGAGLASLATLLAVYNDVALAAPAAVYDRVVEMTALYYGVSGNHVARRIHHLGDPANPFDDPTPLRAIISNAGLGKELGLHLMIWAPCALLEHPLAKAATKKISEEDPAVIDAMPIAGPFFECPHLWQPLAWRTQFTATASETLKAPYASLDPWETRLLRIIAEDGLKEGKAPGLRPSVDHRSWALGVLSRVAQQSGLGGRTPRSRALDLVGVEALGEVLDEVADRLYAPPYYVSEAALMGKWDREIVALARKALPTRRDLAWGGLGAVPSPVYNPASLLGLFRTARQGHAIRREHGWLLHLINIVEASPALGLGSATDIEVTEIQFLDDRIYTKAPWYYVLNERTGTLHYAPCAHVKRMSSADAVLFDSWLPGSRDFRPCGLCLRNHPL